MKPQNIAVIGGGIVGVSTAEWLRRDGHSVTIFDPTPTGDEAQASFGNGGILARAAIIPVAVPGFWKSIPSMLLRADGPAFLKWSYLPKLIPWLIPFLRSGSEENVRRIASSLSDLLNDSVEQHLALARGTPAEAFIETGDYAYLYKDRQAFEKDSFGFALRAEHGINWREIEGEALHSLDPNLADEIGFAAIMPDHGWVRDPGRYLAALMESFRHGGGRHMALKVDAIESDASGPLLRAGGEEHRFERIVLAAGIWSRHLAESLGHRIPLESERGYHLMLRGPSFAPAFPYMVADSKFVVTPMEGGIRCAGLVEFGGTEAPPSSAPIDLIRRRIKRLYPSIEWDSETVWLGHRPSTIDSLPLIGESERAPGVYFAFGAQHVGLTSGPKTGRIIADLIAGRVPNFDLAPFAAGRFDRP